MPRIAAVVAIGGGLALTGCSSIADLGYSEDGAMVAVFNRVQCELYNARKKPGSILNPGEGERSRWSAVGSVELMATDNGSLSPDLAYKNAFSAGAVSWGLVPNVSGSLKRTYQEYYMIDIGAVSSTDCDQAKAHEGNRVGVLEGELGIENAIDRLSQSYVDPTEFEFGTKPGSNVVMFYKVDFTLSYGVGRTGPTWTLKHFNGPGSLLGLGREHVSTITIGFVPPPKTPRAVPKGSKSDEVKPKGTDKLQFRTAPIGTHTPNARTLGVTPDLLRQIDNFNLGRTLR